jgi:hypothetical protein
MSTQAKRGRLGIPSRPTAYRWINGYNDKGPEGLTDRSPARVPLFDLFQLSRSNGDIEAKFSRVKTPIGPPLFNPGNMTIVAMRWH